MPRILFIIIGALISFFLFRASGSLGPAAITTSLLVPFAPAYVGMRFGSGSGGAAVIVAAAMIMAFGGVGNGLVYILQFGVMAVSLPWFLKNVRRWDRAVAYTLAVVMMASVLGLWGYAALQGKGPLVLAGGIVEKEVTQTSELMHKVFADTAPTAAAQAEFTSAVEQMAGFMRRAYPGMIILVSGLLLLAMVALLNAIRQGHYQVTGPAFADWKAPEILVWLLIAGGFVVVFASGAAQTAAMNLLVVLLPVYFLQGLAVIDCFFRRKALSPALRVLGYVMVTLVNPLPVLVTGIGVFDLWIDFRKPREQNN